MVCPPPFISQGDAAPPRAAGCLSCLFFPGSWKAQSLSLKIALGPTLHTQARGGLCVCVCRGGGLSCCPSDLRQGRGVLLCASERGCQSAGWGRCGAWGSQPCAALGAMTLTGARPGCCSHYTDMQRPHRATPTLTSPHTCPHTHTCTQCNMSKCPCTDAHTCPYTPTNVFTH